MAIVKFVPLLSLKAQMAETDMYTSNFANSLQYYNNNYLELEIYHHFHAYICVSATFAITGRSVTNLIMAVP